MVNALLRSDLSATFLSALSAIFLGAHSASANELNPNFFTDQKLDQTGEQWKALLTTPFEKMGKSNLDLGLERQPKTVDCEYVLSHYENERRLNKAETQNWARASADCIAISELSNARDGVPLKIDEKPFLATSKIDRRLIGSIRTMAPFKISVTKKSPLEYFYAETYPVNLKRPSSSWGGSRLDLKILARITPTDGRAPFVLTLLEDSTEGEDFSMCSIAWLEIEPTILIKKLVTLGRCS